MHAGAGIEAEQRGKLERLCRYVSRPAVAEQRLALTERGEVHVQLKSAYRDGTHSHSARALDFLARLAALVPPPRAHLSFRSSGYLRRYSQRSSPVTPSIACVMSVGFGKNITPSAPPELM